MFKKHLEINNYSDRTIELYLNDLKDFYNFIQEYNNLTFKDVTRTEVLQFLYYLNDKGIKTTTRHHKFFAVKSFYKWYRGKHPMIDPTYSVESGKIAKRIPKTLTFNQAKDLVDVYENLKYKMLIKMFLNTGLRVSEVCNIRLEDVDMSNCCLNVKCKGNRTRQVNFTTKLSNELKIYCSKFQPINYLFESYKGKQYSRRRVHEIVSEAYKELGLKGFTVHSLRHTVATMLYENTKDIKLVKEFLGHESIESTIIYTHVNNEILKEAVKRNPLNEEV